MDSVPHGRDERFVWYILSGDFDPDDITTATGLAPTKIGRKGDRVRASTPTAHRLEESQWVIDSGLAQSDEFHQHLEALIDRLRPGWRPLSSLGRAHKASVQAAIYCREAQGPLIEVAPQAAAALGELNAMLGFDIYALAEEVPDQDPRGA